MKTLFILEFIFLFSSIRGDPNPNLIVIPREQHFNDNVLQTPINSMRPKAIVISHMNGQLVRDEPNPVMRAVMSAVQSHFKQDMTNELNNESNANDTNSENIPEIVISDTDQGFDQSMYSSPEMFRKVYNLPPMTRMIASEEESDNAIKKSPVWRSPLPFLHHHSCPHHRHMSARKAKSMKKRSRKQRKPEMGAEVEPSTTAKPEINETPEPLRSLLMSIISHSISQSESEPNVDNEVRAPTAFLMSISRRPEPEVPELTMTPKSEDSIPSPSLPLFLSLIQKKLELESEPELSNFLPFNPFLALLDKIHKPFVPKTDSETNNDKEMKRISNFNFNVNFTINNNYPQQQPHESESRRPPFMPFPPRNRFSILHSL